VGKLLLTKQFAAFKTIIVDFVIALLVRSRQVGHNALGMQTIKAWINFAKSSITLAQ